MKSNYLLKKYIIIIQKISMLHNKIELMPIKEEKELTEEEIIEMEKERRKFYSKLKAEKQYYDNNKPCIYCLMASIMPITPVIIVVGPFILLPYFVGKSVYHSLNKKKIHPEITD